MIAFLQERVFSKQSSIRDTITRNKGINFTNDYISKAPGDAMKQKAPGDAMKQKAPGDAMKQKAPGDAMKQKANQMESNGLVAIF